MILFYFWQTAVPILHTIAGESGVQEKENPQLTPLQDQIDMSNKELQLKFIVHREDNRQMILAKKSTSSKKILENTKAVLMLLELYNQWQQQKFLAMDSYACKSSNRYNAEIQLARLYYIHREREREREEGRERGTEADVRRFSSPSARSRRFLCKVVFSTGGNLVASARRAWKGRVSLHACMQRPRLHIWKWAAIMGKFGHAPNWDTSGHVLSVSLESSR
jgi:hypothetical protein